MTYNLHITWFTFTMNVSFSLEEEPYKCINRTCQLDKEREKNVPPEYIKAGLFGHFYISEEELSWPQAQYDCQGREGLLAEVTGICPKTVYGGNDTVKPLTNN